MIPDVDTLIRCYHHTVVRKAGGALFFFLPAGKSASAAEVCSPPTLSLHIHF